MTFNRRRPPLTARDPRPVIALTMGDPAGIGPEIVVKLAADPSRPPATLLAVGDVGVLRRTAAVLGAALDIRPVTGPREARALPQGAAVLAVLQAGDDLPATLPMGRIDARAGAGAHAAILRAADLAIAGEVCAVVTGPIHKEALAAAGVRHPGHTEILAERCGVADVAMMLANDALRVLLVSIHLSLAEAIAAVTPQAELRAIRFAHQGCRAFGVSRPRVAVAGLNPHAGENGLFGREDLDVIAPAVAQARREGIDASGPFSPDTVFMRARRGEFDVVVAQHHDQGLIPVKYLGVDQGVNITVGLPFVRTSVDHGTAFDIAGTGRADHSSLRYALQQAIAMTAAVRGERAA